MTTSKFFDPSGLLLQSVCIVELELWILAQEDTTKTLHYKSLQNALTTVNSTCKPLYILNQITFDRVITVM